jgi:hypothetical protein
MQIKLDDKNNFINKKIHINKSSGTVAFRDFAYTPVGRQTQYTTLDHTSSASSAMSSIKFT